MADLFQSHYDLGSLRRGVEDGERLWELLAEDGSITIVPDPGEGDVEAASKELTKLHEQGEAEDDEKEATRQGKIAAASRVVSFQPPPSAEPIVPEEEDEEKASNRRASQEREKAEAK